MGPNSQRRRQAKGGVTLANAPARARFSNWRPPVKRGEAGRGRGRGGRDRDRGGRDSDSGGGRDSRSSALTVYESNEGLSGEERLPEALLGALRLTDKVTVPDDILASYIEELEDIFYEEEQRAMSTDNAAHEEEQEERASESVKAPVVFDIKTPPAAPVPPAATSSSSSGGVAQLTKADKKLFQGFRSLGFSTEELQAARQCSAGGAGTTAGADHDELYLSLLLSLPTARGLRDRATAAARSSSSSCCIRNELLDDECAALQNIYEDLIFIRTVPSLLGAPTLIIDLSIIEFHLSTRIFLFNTPAYPGAGCALLAWIGQRDDQRGATGECSACDRQVCCEAIHGVNEMLRVDGSGPVIFDLIRMICEGIHDGCSMNATAIEATAAVASAAVPVVVVLPPTPSGGLPTPAEAPKEKETFYMKTREYRESLLAALNEGLEGRQARDRARELLRDVHGFGDDALCCVLREQEAEEQRLRTAFDIDELSKKAFIDMYKEVMDEIGIKKVKAKALLATAVKEIQCSDNRACKNEEMMKDIVIDHAIQIYIDRSAMAEEKALLKQKKAKRGMTLREARELQRSQLEGGAEQPPQEQQKEKKQQPPPPPQKQQQQQKGPSVLVAAPEPLPEPFSLQAYESERLQPHFNTPQSDTLRQELLRRAGNKNYSKIRCIREALPAFASRDEVIRKVYGNRVVVVSGATGSGKTTQVVQLLLDDYIGKGVGAAFNCIITQPRRISAISVAERIAFERCEQVGQTVGYHVRLEAKKSQRTRILLLTTGVLLRMLQVDGNLSQYTHIILDEVHERNIDSDFLMIILKSILRKEKHLKVILMSATINASIFSDYFKEFGVDKVDIPGRSFPTTAYYLEDLLEQTGLQVQGTADCVYKPPRAPKGASKGPASTEAEMRTRRLKFLTELVRSRGYSDRTLRSLQIVDEGLLNLELVVQLCVKICADSFEGGILIFVAGIEQIKKLSNALQGCNELSRCKVFPLHSSLPTNEQNKVFSACRERKIVVATNIAETSITIEDIVFVIDTVRAKENRFDEVTKLNVLEEVYTSRANSMQRRGRAGRVKPGVYFSLISSFTHEHVLEEYTKPEMLRLSLDSVVLQILALDLGAPKAFLAKALTPPSPEKVDSALQILENLQALTVDGADAEAESDSLAVPTAATKRGKDEMWADPQLSAIGFHIAALPVSPYIGKIILIGCFLKCIDPVLTVAAIVSSKSPFISPFDEAERENADAARRQFSRDESDLLANVAAFNEWRRLSYECETKRQGGKGGNKKDYFEARSILNSFCHSNYISNNACEIIDDIRDQLLTLLKDIGFAPQNAEISTLDSNSSCNANGNDSKIVKAVLSSLPNVLVIPNSCFEASGYLNKKLSECSLDGCGKSTFMLGMGSTLAGSKRLSSRYACYLEAVQSATRNSVRDITTVHPLSLCLFASKFKSYRRHGVVVLDGWVALRVSEELAHACQLVRDFCETSFSNKIINPHISSDAATSKVISVISKMIQSSTIESPYHKKK